MLAVSRKGAQHHQHDSESSVQKVLNNPDLVERILYVGDFQFIDIARIKRVCSLWCALVRNILPSSPSYSSSQPPTVSVIDPKMTWRVTCMEMIEDKHFLRRQQTGTERGGGSGIKGRPNAIGDNNSSSNKEPRRFFLAAGSLELITIWCLRDFVLLRSLTGHKSWIYCLQALPNGRLASGSKDKTIKVWDVMEGTCLMTLSGHLGGIRALQYVPAVGSHQPRLISASRDKTIKVWYYEESDACWHTMKNKLRGASVHSIKVIWDGEALLSGHKDGSIQLWDLHTYKKIASTRQHKGGVNRLVILKDGRLISSCIIRRSPKRKKNPLGKPSSSEIKVWQLSKTKGKGDHFVCQQSLDVQGIVRDMKVLPGGWLAVTDATRDAPTKRVGSWKTRESAGAGVSLYRLYNNNNSGDTSCLELDVSSKVTYNVPYDGHSSQFSALAVLPNGTLAGGSRRKWGVDDRIQMWDFNGMVGEAFAEYYGRPITIETATSDSESDEDKDNPHGADIDACDSLSD